MTVALAPTSEGKNARGRLLLSPFDPNDSPGLWGIANPNFVLLSALLAASLAARLDEAHVRLAQGVIPGRLAQGGIVVWRAVHDLFLHRLRARVHGILDLGGEGSSHNGRGMS